MKAKAATAALRWLALGLMLIIAYAIASALIVPRLVDFNDARHHVDFTVGIALPLHVAWQAIGEWRLTLCVWALAVGLAIAGTQVMRSLGDNARPRTVVLIQALMLGALLFVTVTFSGDVYAYVIYGRLYGLYGLNPYVLGAPVPAGDDGVLRTALAFYGNPPPSDNYGPLWTLLAGAAARIESGLTLAAQAWTHRVVAALGALAATGGLIYALRRLDVAEQARRAARFALHPIVLYEAAVGGHNDLLMIAPAIWAFALADELPLAAGLLLGASIAVKYVSAIAVPFLMVRAAKRGMASVVLSGAISLALPALFFRPFWSGAQTMYSLIGHGGVLAMSPQWLVDIPIFSSGIENRPAFGSSLALPFFGELTWPRIVQLAALVVFLIVAVLSIARYARARHLADLWRTIAASVLSLPVIHPWYALWMSAAAADTRQWATFAWWFGLFAFLRYALDGVSPQELGGAYTPLLAILTVVMVGAPALIALRDRQARPITVGDRRT